MGGVKVNMSYADGKTIDTFAKVIAARQQWCHESARGSVAACAIDCLRSLRTKTRIAKPSGVKVVVKRDNSLFASCETRGRQRIPCIRYLGSKKKYSGSEKVVIADNARLGEMKVYRYAEDHGSRSYLIVASNMTAAKAKAKQIATRKAMRYAGLARRALGMLMYKTNTQRVSDPLDPRVELKADEVTAKRETVTKRGDGGVYMLQLNDALRYALDALKGGRAEVDASLKRSMNKIVSVINQKLKKHRNDFFSPFKLDTPFPELKQRRAAK